MKGRRVSQISRLLFSVLTLCLSGAVGWSVLRIWREGAARRGEDPLAVIYSPESAAAYGRRLLPLLLLWLVSLGAALFLGRGSRERLPRGAVVMRPVREAAKPRLRGLLLALALLLILLGILDGGARQVLVKAVNICTECIGLG